MNLSTKKQIVGLLTAIFMIKAIISVALIPLLVKKRPKN